MRILAFDHFFDQDLDALREGLDPSDSLAVVPYQRLYYLARLSFPNAAFGGIKTAYAPTYRASWALFRWRASRFADWLLAAHRPDVFVVPSDTFFYLRPVIERFAQLGLPTVVVQKETTISPMVMEEHSRDVGGVVPFISELMAVCSERHRQFWLAAGTDPQRVIVTGQPRFDIYAHDRATGAIPDHPSILYLSYDDNAYLPSDLGHDFTGSWEAMRRATEQALADVAQRGRARVVAKPHPQQRRQQDWLGPSVERAHPGADTRTLILQADLVVGFQTTAVFEAAASGRPVIYAAWGPVYELARELLIPFDQIPGLVNPATSVDELRSLLEKPALLERPSAGALVEVAEHLGPLDGQATERVVHVLRAHAVTRPPHRVSWTLVAAVLLGQLARPALAAVAALLARSPITKPRSIVARRRAVLQQEWRELCEIVRSRRSKL